MDGSPELKVVSGTATRAPVPGGPACVAINSASGSSDKQAARDAIAAAIRGAGRELRFFDCRPSRDMAATCRRAADEARRTGGILVAAGGDGTVNLAASASRDFKVALGIVPLGTFNYFARLHGIPLEPEAAARVLVDGVLAPVAVGEVNGRLFLNNASFGLYTRVIYRREAAKARFGRHRIVAFLSALGALLAGQKPFAVRLVAGNAEAIERTSMVFVANNPMQLQALGLDAQACMRGASLGVLLLRPTGWRDRLRLLLRTALKELDQDHRLASFCAEAFEVQSVRRAIELVIDGEIVPVRMPLAFRTDPQALQLAVPRLD